MLARGVNGFVLPPSEEDPQVLAPVADDQSQPISFLIMLFDQIEQLRLRRLDCAAVSSVIRLNLG